MSVGKYNKYFLGNLQYPHLLKKSDEIRRFAFSGNEHNINNHAIHGMYT